MLSSVASAANSLAFSILKAPSISLTSNSGGSSNIFRPQIIDTPVTMEAVVHALIAMVVAS